MGTANKEFVAPMGSASAIAELFAKKKEKDAAVAATKKRTELENQQREARLGSQFESLKGEAGKLIRGEGVGLDPQSIQAQRDAAHMNIDRQFQMNIQKLRETAASRGTLSSTAMFHLERNAMSDAAFSKMMADSEINEQLFAARQQQVMAGMGMMGSLLTGERGYEFAKMQLEAQQEMAAKARRDARKAAKSAWVGPVAGAAGTAAGLALGMPTGGGVGAGTAVQGAGAGAVLAAGSGGMVPSVLY